MNGWTATRWIHSLLLIGMELSAPVGLPAQETGTIHGRVLYRGQPPHPQKLLVVKDTAICGQMQHYDERLIVGQENGIRNAVVSLINIKGGKPLQTMGTEFVLDQKNCAYRPHVLLTPIGTPVQFLNNDQILHNIHTYSAQNPPVNLAQPKYQTKLEQTFDAPERVQVRCDVHGWMSAWIIVVDHPYHAVTDPMGAFTITGIPPGTYTLRCWQELLGEQTVQVEIAPGAGVALDFTYNPEE